jgi:hypothetical protein
VLFQIFPGRELEDRLLGPYILGQPESSASKALGESFDLIWFFSLTLALSLDKEKLHKPLHQS